MVEYPEVLMLVLNRWNNQFGASLHSIKANEVLYFWGRRYALASTVSHLGPTPNAGHYIAVVKHGHGENPWYLYDDDDCRPATPDVITTECANYKNQGNMQSYILIYVKDAEVISDRLFEESQPAR